AGREDGLGGRRLAYQPRHPDPLGSELHPATLRQPGRGLGVLPGQRLVLTTTGPTTPPVRGGGGRHPRRRSPAVRGGQDTPSAAAVSVRSACRLARARSRAGATSPTTGSTTSRYALSFGSVPEGRTTSRPDPVRSTSTSA